jgi:hypothetical protein
MAVLCLSFAAQTRAQSNTPCTLVRVSHFGGSNTLEIVSRDEYVTLRKEVEQDNAAMEKAFNELRQDWKKRHDRMITQTYTDKDGRQQETKVKAPVPLFPLRRPPDREMHPVFQFPSIEAAEAKKTELEGTASATGLGHLKRADPSKKASGGDNKRREDKGYLPDDPSAEQLEEQLMVKFEEISQAPDAAGDDKGKKDKSGREIRRLGAGTGKGLK